MKIEFVDTTHTSLNVGDVFLIEEQGDNFVRIIVETDDSTLLIIDLEDRVVIGEYKSIEQIRDYYRHCKITKCEIRSIGLAKIREVKE